jgi:hypothetical protein
LTQAGYDSGLKELKLKSNCFKEFEKVLKLGRRPVKLLCDKSNTVRFAEGLKIDVGIIEPLKWFELKFTDCSVEIAVRLGGDPTNAFSDKSIDVRPVMFMPKP